MRRAGSTLILIVFLVSFSSCAGKKHQSEKAVHAWDITQISLDQHKNHIVDKLGGYYTPVALEYEEEHKLEIIEIATKEESMMRKMRGAADIYYWFFFLDDKLFKFQRMAQGERLGGQTELKKFRDQILPSLLIKKLPI